MSCELLYTTNGFKTKEIFLSEENFPEWARTLTLIFFLYIRFQGAAYSTPGPPNHPGYAAPINQGQYVPQLQQNVPYQASGPAPQEYSYPTSQVHGQYQPEYAATYSW